MNRKWIIETRATYERECAEGSQHDRLRVIYDLKEGSDELRKKDQKCDNFVCELLNVDAKVLKELQDGGSMYCFVVRNSQVAISSRTGRIFIL